MRDFRITYKHSGWGGWAAKVVSANTYREVLEDVGNPAHVRSLTMRCAHENCKRWVNTEYCFQHEGLHTND